MLSSEVLGLYSSLRMRDQVSQPCKTTGKYERVFRTVYIKEDISL